MTYSGIGNPNELYALAVQSLRDGRHADCLDQVDRLVLIVGPNSAVLQVRALSLQATGEVHAALDVFRQSIALQAPPGDPYLFANAAALAEQLRHDGEALEWYARAAEIGPLLIDIQLARIVGIRRMQGDNAAADAFDGLVATHPRSPDLHHHHALFLRDCGDTFGALAAVSRCLAIRPDSANARQLAARIKLDAGTADPADFTALGNTEDVTMGAAAAWVQRGEMARALDWLDRALDLHPDWHDALQARLSISQQMQSFDAAADWLRQLDVKRGNPADLRRAVTKLIWRGCGARAALDELGSLGQNPDAPLADQLLRADLLSEAGEQALADQAWAQIAPNLTTLPPYAQTVQIRHMFRSGLIEDGAQRAHSLARTSGLVEAWAYVELGWRIMADPRHPWLLGEGALIAQHSLDEFAEYHALLVERLRELHQSIAHHPLEQSARHGTQTDGPLFSQTSPEIRRLVRDIRHGVARYLTEIPDLGREHPMDRLRRRNFRFSGSWSIRLTQSGYHAPHFHSDGVISSACHISLPPCLCDPDTEQQQPGWLELGRPPNFLGLDVAPVRVLRPQEGVLALFPSFLFHGTRPFDDGERLTVAFDVASIVT